MRLLWDTHYFPVLRDPIICVIAVLFMVGRLSGTFSKCYGLILSDDLDDLMPWISTLGSTHDGETSTTLDMLQIKLFRICINFLVTYICGINTISASYLVVRMVNYLLFRIYRTWTPDRPWWRILRSVVNSRGAQNDFLHTDNP